MFFPATSCNNYNGYVIEKCSFRVCYSAVIAIDRAMGDFALLPGAVIAIVV